MYKIKKNWPIIVSIILAMVIAGGCWVMLQKQIRHAEETVDVIVPLVDIGMYSKITQNDVEMRKLSPTVVDKNTIIALGDIIGKMPKYPLFKGKPIDKRMVVEHKQLGNKQIIGVNIDNTRAGGVKEGDLVDVYWLNSISTGQSSIGKTITDTTSLQITNMAALISQDSQVIKIANSSIPGQNMIIYLLVNSADVPAVIQGSSPKSQEIALAKK